ncbi:hypothetical protein FJZ36_10485 [Candidatus Poribacteria bacterium]|nr:hypothetical protein [Candidatus Poribacteria bacterium]
MELIGIALIVIAVLTYDFRMKEMGKEGLLKPKGSSKKGATNRELDQLRAEVSDVRQSVRRMEEQLAEFMIATERARLADNAPRRLPSDDR